MAHAFAWLAEYVGKAELDFLGACKQMLALAPWEGSKQAIVHAKVGGLWHGARLFGLGGFGRTVGVHGIVAEEGTRANHARLDWGCNSEHRPPGKHDLSQPRGGEHHRLV